MHSCHCQVVFFLGGIGQAGGMDYAGIILSSEKNFENYLRMLVWPKKE